MAFNNAQFHPVVGFKNQGFPFSKYDMDISSLIAGLGWESLTKDQRFLHCPEAVRLFYVNIRRDHATAPRSFTTMVYDHEIKVTPDLLASVLSLPHSGIKASYDSDFAEQGFDFCVARDRLTCDIGKTFSNQLSAGRLPDDLKVLHFFITRCFLPRDITTFTQSAISAIDGEVKRQRETGNAKTTNLLVCKECLELMEFDEARLAPDDCDPISSDSSSKDEISYYESPPSYPF
ncbi:unnamed protein product [Linum trigynum]|uniref:Uncharacterized protein n=1 Tax=Linum trigynum TaxID=586398 RepID=A0AAV2E0V7_9ROSI